MNDDPTSGAIRLGRIFWEELSEANPELFSELNRALIQDGRCPVVDETWLKYYPDQKPYYMDTLWGVQVNGGSRVVPFPKSAALRQFGSKVF